MKPTGGKPKPTHLKLLQGNPGGRPLNAKEPKSPPMGPKAPRWLSKAARKEWKRLMPILLDSGLLTRLDTDAFGRLCQTTAQLHEADRGLEEHGMLVKSPNGYPQQSPYFTLCTALQKRLWNQLTEFGMTPSSRSRIEVEAKTPVDDFETYLNHGKGTKKSG